MKFDTKVHYEKYRYCERWLLSVRLTALEVVPSKYQNLYPRDSSNLIRLHLSNFQ